jgi:VanZ family protein
MSTPEPARPTPFVWHAVHVLVLLAVLGLWTWKLLEPNPVPEAIEKRLTGGLRFAAAKALHAGGYGLLTLLAVTLPVPTAWRWYFAGLLALHGVATEIGQTFVPGREGCVRDVLIDWGGVCAAVGVWCATRWVVGRRGGEPPATPAPADHRE